MLPGLTPELRPSITGRGQHMCPGSWQGGGQHMQPAVHIMLLFGGTNMQWRPCRLHGQYTCFHTVPTEVITASFHAQPLGTESCAED